VVIGDWKPIDLGRGEYARWSPDGEKIAVYDRRKIFVMDMDGSNRKLVTDEAWQKNGCPIEWAADIYNRKMRKLADFHNYSGEPGISADGTRMASRLDGDVWAIDLVKKTDFMYARGGCSSGISPDGRWLMSNRGDHKSMNIRSWNGKKTKVLRSSIGRWDNQTWSNHNDYICAEGEKTGDSYVVKVSTGRGTRVTWVGNTVYPDLYVAATATTDSS
jgi:Tol biopolymer transport system component